MVELRFGAKMSNVVEVLPLWCRVGLLFVFFANVVYSTSEQQPVSNGHEHDAGNSSGAQDLSDHGGIPMGKVPDCDDAQSNIEIDWNPNSTNESTCLGAILKPTIARNVSECEDRPSQAIHVCLNSSITYEDAPPTSGIHRPMWPVYGEYRYAPPQRWLHSLEHGGIVMLYHPCADPIQVQVMKEVVRDCLRKHIITPYPDLPEDTPLAVLSWGCKLMMSHPSVENVVDFIMNHANRGREGNVAAQGQYREGLVNASHVVSDIRDSQLCPNFRPTEHAQILSTPSTKPTNEGQPPPVNRIVEQSQNRRLDLEQKTNTAQKILSSLMRVFKT